MVVSWGKGATWVHFVKQSDWEVDTRGIAGLLGGRQKDVCWVIVEEKEG